MTTVLTTMADALIDFILSLLRDPAVSEEFDADPGNADRVASRFSSQTPIDGRRRRRQLTVIIAVCCDIRPSAEVVLQKCEVPLG